MKYRLNDVLLCIVFLFIVLLLGLVFFNRNKELRKQDDITEENIQEYVKNNEDVKTVTITVVGDLLFETPVIKDILENGNVKYFDRVTNKYFINDGITIGNMEVPIGNSGMKISGDGFNFCSPERIGEFISKQSFEVLSTANNHSFDRNIEGLESTIDFFKNNTDILTVGTYIDENDRANFRVKEVNGITVGFLSYTYGTNVGVPDEYINRVAFFRNPYAGTFNNTSYKDMMTNEVKQLREQVDVLIVMLHWGTEFTYSPSKQQREVANYLNTLGVDVIVGSHSHCMQPIEWIKGEHDTLVYYSMGNFVSADDDISRTPRGQEEFDNSYQLGLLSTFKIIKENSTISICSIATEPIINYFNENLQEFELIPLSEYDEVKASAHYRYKYGLDINWINKVYSSVISEEFR